MYLTVDHAPPSMLNHSTICQFRANHPLALRTALLGMVDLLIGFGSTLRIFGDQFDPYNLSRLLGCTPTKAARYSVSISSDATSRIQQMCRWLLTIDSKDLPENVDVEDGIKLLLERLPTDPDLWASLTGLFKVDVKCGLSLATANRGFGISTEVCQMLVGRHLEINFDVYFDLPETAPE